MDELAKSLFRRLNTVFGTGVQCHYIDVERDALDDYPIIEKLQNKRALKDLPVIMIEGQIFSTGRLYPLRIIDELARKVPRIDR